MTPGDGAGGVPTNARVTVAVSEAVTALSAATAVQVTTGGAGVAGP